MAKVIADMLGEELPVPAQDELACKDSCETRAHRGEALHIEPEAPAQVEEVHATTSIGCIPGIHVERCWHHEDVHMHANNANETDPNGSV